jgi:hypothetical protein
VLLLPLEVRLATELLFLQNLQLLPLDRDLNPYFLEGLLDQEGLELR